MSQPAPGQVTVGGDGSGPSPALRGAGTTWGMSAAEFVAALGDAVAPVEEDELEEGEMAGVGNGPVSSEQPA
ncbi:MAG: hypothetical protein WCF24_03720 [Acidimicrobiales bacterium]